MVVEVLKWFKSLSRKRLIVLITISIIVIWGFFKVFRPFEKSALEMQLIEKEKQEIYALYNSGKIKEALPRIETFDEENDGDVGIKTILASANWLLGKQDRALEVYEEILKIDPNHADTVYRLGILYRQMGKQEESMENLQKAVELNPKNSLFRAELAKGYQMKGEFAKAISQWKAVLKYIPKNTDYRASVWENIGDNYKSLGSNSKARWAYKKGLPYAPKGHSLRQKIR